MAEALLDFNYSVTGPDGRPYRARVCGHPMDNERWEGWLEFEAADAGPARSLRTPRETVQPNRSDLEYWGTGLTPVYLEGALTRALESEVPYVRVVEVTSRSAFDGPAPPPRTVEVPPAPATAVLDPFSVYAKASRSCAKSSRPCAPGTCATSCAPTRSTRTAPSSPRRSTRPS